MIQACIFDMDGVIVDTAVYHFKAWRRLADELSIDIDEHFNEHLKGLSRVDSLDLILQKGGLELDNLTKLRLMDQKNNWYLQHIEDMTPADILPGVSDFFKSIKSKGIKCALGSSSRNAAKILDMIGMKDDFDAMIDGTKVTLHKPDPEVFIKAAGELGVSPSNAVVFEDAVSGIRAAHAGGFKCIGVGDAEKLQEADQVITDMTKANLELLSELA